MELVEAIIARASTHRFALAVSRVIETMRPLPVEPLSGTPEFVRGLAIIRGEAVPVIDLGLMLGAPYCSLENSARFITIRMGQRSAALAVDAILGLRRVVLAEFSTLPQLFSTADARVFDGLAALDGELHLLLREAALISDEVWSNISRGHS